MSSNRHQIILIALGILVTALIGVFFYRELYPEYKIYQKDYEALEEFRSTYTGQPPPPFQSGIKQIVIERADRGPPVIDRCTSCHVALQYPHFSPTKIAHDINGNAILDAEGKPVLVKNEEYIFSKLDAAIADLEDPAVNEQLMQTDQVAAVQRRLNQASQYRNLKTVKVGEHTYQTDKVLAMHPLIGNETRPFEFHPIDQYGCTSCHNGNGRGLTTANAHGPVFDGQYEVAEGSHQTHFTESDPANDPIFAKVFNYKPGHKLLFQTTPLYVGGLIQANCAQCHQTTQDKLAETYENTRAMVNSKQQTIDTLEKGLKNAIEAYITTQSLLNKLELQGKDTTLAELHSTIDSSVITNEKATYQAQLQLLQQLAKQSNQGSDLKDILKQQLQEQMGSAQLVSTAKKMLHDTPEDTQQALQSFLDEHSHSDKAVGSLFQKYKNLTHEKEQAQRVQQAARNMHTSIQSPQTTVALANSVDRLLNTYHRGQQLYVSQACYACHRITGLARGGVGPELTHEGLVYPWFVKESIVWPQADLPTSTMPNFHLDHVELEALVTFLLGQKGRPRTIGEVTRQANNSDWETGRRQSPWEKPVAANQIRDVRYGMTVFATQGCAACHRLKGFESNVGYSVEKDSKPDFDTLYNESSWFKKLIPENITGSKLVEVLTEHGAELDKRIIDDVRQGALLEELQEQYPDLIITFYPPFRFAERAKNSLLDPKKATSAEDKAKRLEQQAQWQKRLQRILMMFVQEYGLGRVIGPSPSWSGVYRSDQWLMEHFRNPNALAANSIMPAMPFDDSKFYALTHMLNVVGKSNRDNVHLIWKEKGFNPAEAYQLFCSQCHGTFARGNGPTAEWIYPIPKNLTNTIFMRNLTRAHATQSIIHGVKGTPMAPWGETPGDKSTYDGIPVLNANEAILLTNWLFSQLPSERNTHDNNNIPRWNYTPQNVIDELKNEGGDKKLLPSSIHSSIHYSTSDELHAGILPSLSKLASLLSSDQKASSELNINDVFEEKKSIISDAPPSYYIRKDHYTPENLTAGQALFELHCAVCHGRDADGNSIRASAMYETKPRMLTNLNWLDTRDDLWLLSSIKYGVAGTAMTPWGDQTSSLQRLQMLMYIRSLTSKGEQQQHTRSRLYQIFDHNIQQINLARSAFGPSMNEQEKEYNHTHQLRLDAANNAQPAEKVAKLYQQELTLLAQLRRNEEHDARLQQLKKAVLDEKTLWEHLSNAIIEIESPGDMLSKIMQAAEVNANSYHFDGTKLIYTTNDSERQKQRTQILEDLLENIARQQQSGSVTPVERENLQKLSSRLQNDFKALSDNEALQASIYKKLEAPNGR
jgi:mono/diheme cytochrome c family protein